MEHWQAIAAATIFLVVIGLIITEWIHLTVAAFLAALSLVFLNIMTLTEAIRFIGDSYSTIALFFGVMVLVRALQPTNIFEYLALQIVLLARGKGKYLLLGIVATTTLFSALLPNATTVTLLAPLIPSLSQIIGIDFVPLLILIVLAANSAGLLTLVGDPVTFIVGESLGITFIDYLVLLAPGGIVAVATLVVTLPIFFANTWKMSLQNLDKLPQASINHSSALSIGLLIAGAVLILFTIGEFLPIPISPAAIALLGAALALLLAHHAGIDSVNNVLRDVDWSTLIFFMSFFVLIGGLEKTSVILTLSGVLSNLLGGNIVLGSVVMLFVVGFVSSLVPNIPLVVAMIPLIKQYVVNIGLSGSEMLSPTFAGFVPMVALPLFYAMLYGATLGGNGTLVGASANIVAAGIAEQHGRRIPFRQFLAYGMPITVLQLFTAALYMTFRFLIWIPSS